MDKNYKFKNIRSIAEKKLQDSGFSNKENFSQEDLTNIIHELNVHQIELEMQNEELLRTQEELENSQIRYFNLYNLAPVGYFCISETGIITNSNLKITNILGLEKCKLINKKITEFIFIEDQDTYYYHLKKLLEGSNYQVSRLRLLKYNYSNVWVHLESNKIVDSDGIINIHTAIIDISTIKKQEEILIENERKYQIQLEKSEAANIAKSNFLANMSHEIRTPLNGFMGVIQLINMTQLTQEQKKYLDTMKESADALLFIINEILDYSKLEAKGIQLERIEFNLKNIINENLNLFKLAASDKNIVIESFIDEDLPNEFYGDPFRLRQIIANLLGNSIKFTNKGVINITVTKVRYIDGGKIKLKFEVKDTGIGISKDQRKLLFERFSQVDNSNARKYGGSGLGLAISKNLVELMDGEIWVESEELRGCSVFFTCILEVIPSDNSKNVQVTKQKGVPKLKQTINILLVEDDDINIMIIQAICQKKGWHINIAKNGKAAVAIKERLKFDFIIMDVQMPYMDGYETTEIIRQFESKKNIYTPIIGVTANAFDEDKNKCIESGMDYYMSKPINLDEFCELIEKWSLYSNEAERFDIHSK